MPIWVSRMTRWALALILAGGAAQAEGVWDVFEARCIDTFENHAPANVAGLTVHSTKGSRTFFGPITRDAYIVVDVEPSDGDRSCGLMIANSAACTSHVVHHGIWRTEAVKQNRYASSDDGMLLTTEWIEPRLKFEARSGELGTFYEIIETELES